MLCKPISVIMVISIKEMSAYEKAIPVCPMAVSQAAYNKLYAYSADRRF